MFTITGIRAHASHAPGHDYCTEVTARIYDNDGSLDDLLTAAEAIQHAATAFPTQPSSPTATLTALEADQNTGNHLHAVFHLPRRPADVTASLREQHPTDTTEELEAHLERLTRERLAANPT